MRETQAQVSRTFDVGPVLPIRALGYLLVAGGSLAIGAIAWRLRSLSLGIAYIVVGTFFAFLDTLTWKLAAEINGATPVLPQPVASSIADIYLWQNGLLNAVPIIGAATLVGLAVVVAIVVGPSSDGLAATPIPDSAQRESVKPSDALM
jgi:hypothetical protein